MEEVEALEEDKKKLLGKGNQERREKQKRLKRENQENAKVYIFDLQFERQSLNNPGTNSLC